MPLSKEKMRLYMNEYRKNNPDYMEKIKQNYNNLYNNNLDFKEKRKEYFKLYNLKKKEIINVESIA